MQNICFALVSFLCLLTRPLMAQIPLPSPDTAAPAEPEVLLVLENIRPLDGDHRGHLYIKFAANAPAETAQAFADYNEKSENPVDVKEISLEGGRITGVIRVTIGPDGARRGRAYFPTPSDVFTIQFTAELSADQYARNRPDREAFMPSWRKDTPPLAGYAVKGSYTAQWQPEQNGGIPVEGNVGGSWRPLPQGSGWHPVGAAMLTPLENGLGIHFFLPETPRVDMISGWAEYTFPEPVPIDFGGFRVQIGALDAASSVDPLPVSLQVQTNRGWFYAMDRIATTRDSSVSTTVLFSEMGDEWRPFAGDHIQAIRLGVENGDGVGRVAFVLKAVEPQGTPPPRLKKEIMEIVVRPEIVRSLNGADTIPPGLFGFHVVNGENPRQPRAGEPDALEMISQLRPGLMRPLTHTGFGSGHGVSEKMEALVRAGEASDLVVWTHTMDLWARPDWLDQGLEALTKRVEYFYADMAARAWRPETPERILRYFEVWNEPFMWGRHINMGFRLPEGNRDVQDETQFGYIPGKLGADAWSEIFLAAVKGAKAVNPHAQLGGPSVTYMASHNYQDFRNYTLRILEKVGDKLDFFTEHHYGGNPLQISATYEVLRSAMWTLHQRQIPIINTEANDLGASDAGKALYNITEILNLILTQPDLVKGRALHALWNGYLNSSGERDAWLLMAPLRGKILDLSVDSPRMTAVAALPEPGKVVLLGADHGFGDVEVRLSIPEGFGTESLTLLLTQNPAAELQVRDVDGAALPEIPEGKTHLVEIHPSVNNGVMTFDLPERSAFRLNIKREGFVPGQIRKQTLVSLPLLFETLQADQVLELNPVQPLPDAKRLFLRLVYTGSLLLEYGDRRFPLPRGAHRLGEASLQTVEVPVAVITHAPRLRALEGQANLLAIGWLVEE